MEQYTFCRLYLTYYVCRCFLSSQDNGYWILFLGYIFIGPLALASLIITIIIVVHVQMRVYRLVSTIICYYSTSYVNVGVNRKRPTKSRLKSINKPSMQFRHFKSVWLHSSRCSAAYFCSPQLCAWGTYIHVINSRIPNITRSVILCSFHFSYHVSNLGK